MREEFIKIQSNVKTLQYTSYFSILFGLSTFGYFGYQFFKEK